MNELKVVDGQEFIITTFDMWNKINQFKVEAGENRVRHDDFIKRVVDECDDLEECENFAHPKSKKPMTCYDLNMDQALLVGMRESKVVRKMTLNWIRSLESRLEQQENKPMVIDSKFLLQMAQQMHEIEQQRDIAIKTKAEIGNRREATAMNTASQKSKEVKRLEITLDASKEYSTIRKMEIITGEKYNWRELKKESIALGIGIKSVPDELYGSVKSYHKDVWLNCYGVDITDI